MGKYKVVIDPGHGGFDPGAVGKNGVKEKDVALAIALYLKDMLSPIVNVFLTRNKDCALGENVSSDLTARANYSNGIKADCFVSIHCNSSTNNAAKGAETYYIEGSVNGNRLANLIQKRLITDVKLQNRGIKTSNFAVLRQTDMPACLVEIAFLSNKEEEQLLSDISFQKKAALSIAKGIAKYLGIPWQNNMKEESKIPEQWKLDIIEKSMKDGLITEKHNPDDLAHKWFVLATIGNMFNILREELKGGK